MILQTTLKIGQFWSGVSNILKVAQILSFPIWTTYPVLIFDVDYI